ncbi:Hypothetical predicted protein, partial [Paramuricea clavata]
VSQHFMEKMVQVVACTVKYLMHAVSQYEGGNHLMLWNDMQQLILVHYTVGLNFHCPIAPANLDITSSLILKAPLGMSRRPVCLHSQDLVLFNPIVMADSTIRRLDDQCLKHPPYHQIFVRTAKQALGKRFNMGIFQFKSRVAEFDRIFSCTVPTVSYVRHKHLILPCRSSSLLRNSLALRRTNSCSSENNFNVFKSLKANTFQSWSHLRHAPKHRLQLNQIANKQRIKNQKTESQNAVYYLALLQLDLIYHLNYKGCLKYSAIFSQLITAQSCHPLLPLLRVSKARRLVTSSSQAQDSNGVMVEINVGPHLYNIIFQQRERSESSICILLTSSMEKKIYLRVRIVDEKESKYI